MTNPAPLAAAMANNIAGSDTPSLAEIPSKIEVASYFNKTFQGAWKGRTRAMFAGIALGLVSGLAVGSLAFLPLAMLGVIGTPCALLAIAFAGAAGLWQGQSAAADAGVTAGAISAAFEEREAREIASKISRGELPPEAAKVKRNINGQPLPVSSSVAISSPEEVNLHSKNFSQMVNFKVMLSFIAVGALIGLFIGAAAPAAIPSALLFSKLGAPATGALILGANGALFGFNYSVILNKITNFMGDWLSGSVFNGKEIPTPTQLAVTTPNVEREIAASKTVDEPQANLAQPFAEDTAIGKFTGKEQERRAQASQPGIASLAASPA